MSIIRFLKCHHLCDLAACIKGDQHSGYLSGLVSLDAYRKCRMWKLAVLFLTALFAVGFGQMPGGVTDIDINDEGAQFALNHAMEKYNRDSNDVYLYKVVKVIKVQGQVVEGYKYIITVRIARTLCRKDSVIGLCSITNHPNVKVVIVERKQTQFYKNSKFFFLLKRQ
uniref:Cystatin domain-containing protein n=1 Tax=Oryzias melastigma TaxID=30732 RepID=A0A3B3DWH0_ORYME